MKSGQHQGIGMTSQRTRDRMVGRLVEQGIGNFAVLDVMRSIPRHIFIDEALASRAYDDTALPIGHGQTLSQPYVVARMTEALLRDGPLKKVLEIGTGSGYQAAVLAKLVAEVYTVERIEALIPLARHRFQELRLRNIRVRSADGTDGWREYAPYDGILAAAAPRAVPHALLDQLAIGGRLVIPIGEAGDQNLILITRTNQGFQDETLGRVSFVPMRSGQF